MKGPEPSISAFTSKLPSSNSFIGRTDVVTIETAARKGVCGTSSSTRTV